MASSYEAVFGSFKARNRIATLADMAVYVDDARIRSRGLSWSHLVADTADELHVAARALGLRREWAQDKGRTLHYDVPEHLRARAIELGLAEPLHWRELARRRADLPAS
jgi:Protein of unknown function (DUF4031)